MENKTTLLKVGEDIIFGTSGVDYELKPNTSYTVEYDRYAGAIKMHEIPSINLPKKLYVTKEDEKFINKVIDYNNSKTCGTVGVMLAGEKGTGKTVMAKQIAIKSNMPILIIDKSLNPIYLKSLFSKLESIPVCVIFDEIDKLGDQYDDDYMLQVFDGISPTGKILLLCTCNNVDDVNEYLLDRCSRVRYYREFEEMCPSMITSILEDHLTDKSKVGKVTDFIVEKMGLISFDNVASFAEEINNYPNETLEDLFKDMNICEK